MAWSSNAGLSFNASLIIRYDPLWPGTWRFMRFRKDKENANHEKTFFAIMESINDNVEKSDVS